MHVLIVDPHNYAKDLATLLLIHGIQATVYDNTEPNALTLLYKQLQPNITLVDMVKQDGLTVIKTLQHTDPAAKILVMYISYMARHLPTLKELKVKGLLLKQDHLTNIISTIHSIAKGGEHWP